MNLLIARILCKRTLKIYYPQDLISSPNVRMSYLFPYRVGGGERILPEYFHLFDYFVSLSKMPENNLRKLKDVILTKSVLL